MCTEQCAVIGISSKSWRNMFKLEMRLHTRQDKTGHAREALVPEVSEVRWRTSEGAGWRRMALENVDEGRCCWASALVQVPGQPWPPALI